MDGEKDLGLKDKEIEKLTSQLSKKGRLEVGTNIKDVLASGDSNTSNPLPIQASQPVASEPVTTQTSQTDQAPATAKTAEEIEKDKKEFYSIIKPLQTYERDIADTIRNHDASVASINIAAAQKKQEERKQPGAVIEPQKTGTGKAMPILISLVLVFAGAGIIGLVWYFLSNQVAPGTPTTPSLIATSERRVTDTTTQSDADIINDIKNKLIEPTNSRDFVEIYLAATVKTGENGEDEAVVPASVEKFFSLFANDAPPSLIRALGPEWTFGFQKLGENSEPFIFSRVSSFENGFDGMLRWEKHIVKNLKTIFPKLEITLPGEETDEMSKFEDTIIRSKDVRVLKDNLGNIVLMYSFLDPKNLVITTNEETFREILNRYFASQIVR